MDKHEKEIIPAIALSCTEGASTKAELGAPAQAILFCDFCGKSQIETDYMIDAEFARICDQCVDTFDVLIRQRRKAKCDELIQQMLKEKEGKGEL